MPLSVPCSVIIPIYNEEAVLKELYRRLTTVMESVSTKHHLLFINDGSSDRSLDVLKGIHAQDSRVQVVNFSRNFGHQAALSAGYDHAAGEFVIVMDADLQDPPEVIPQLVEKWRSGYHVVYGVRNQRRGENTFKRWTARMFYRLLSRLTNVSIPHDTGDFRLLDRRAINAFQHLKERNRYIRGLISWLGFRQIGVEFDRDPRYAGETKYPFRKMLKFALDGITSFSTVPLQLSSYLGLFVSFLSLLYLPYALWLKLFTDRPVIGWTSLVVAVLFLGGVQLITLGVLGEYIGRIYDEVKQRPLYIIDEAIGLTDYNGDTTSSIVNNAGNQSTAPGTDLS